MQVFKYGQDVLGAQFTLSDSFCDEVEVPNDHLDGEFDHLISYAREVVLLDLDWHQAKLYGKVS